MTKQQPLNIDEALFCPITRQDIDELGDNPTLYAYDRRCDFIVDDDFRGIAVRLYFINERIYRGQRRGIRRRVALTLVDTTARYEVASQTISVCIPNRDFSAYAYATFGGDIFTAGHTYKLTATDLSARGATLGDYAIHLFSQAALGHPSGWYQPDMGGLRPHCMGTLYRSVDADDNVDYYVHIRLRHRFGKQPPIILPELEMRIYYPGSDRIDVRFIEPTLYDPAAGIVFVETPCDTSPEYTGAYYTELLCMEYPIAGFAFSVRGHEVEAQWWGDTLEPLDAYSPEAAEARLRRLLPGYGDDAEAPGPADGKEESDTFSDEDLDAAIDAFIASEREAADPEEEAPADDPEDEPADDDAPDAPTPPAAGADPLAALNRLTGLRAVKEKLTTYERVVRFNRLRADSGLPVAHAPLHAMFLGSPGTGKTTVARMMGVMLRRAGLLSRGHVVVRERATLLGQYYSSEAQNTLAAIDEAQGGILLIDEAYQLFQPDDPRDPGKFVVETLLTALADEHRRDWMLVLAGYPDQMLRLFDLNPGLRSRIPDSNIYRFDDFSEPELMEIAERYLASNRYTLAPDAHAALADRLRADYAHRERNFGNARHVINLIQTEILPAMAVRVTTEAASAPLSEAALTVIRPADIPRPAGPLAPPRPRLGFTA